MATTYLFDQIPDLKEKFKKFFHHRKKMQALDNYSSVAPFQHKDYLMLIKRCMADGFLGEKEAEFLCYMLEKYELNFLDWSHRTKWLKGEMNKLAANYSLEDKKVSKIAQLDLFEEPSTHVAISAAMPFEVFVRQNQRKHLRA